MTLRQQIEIEKFKEELALEEQQKREAEDQQNYQVYVSQMREQRVEPIPFEKWRSLIPEEFRSADAKARGALASSRASWRQLVNMTAERLKQHLTDDEFEELGFEGERIHGVFEVSEFALRDAMQAFIAAEPRFNRDLHLEVLSEFIAKQGIDPTSATNLRVAFDLLVKMNMLPEAPEQRVEEQRSALNGVNLRVEPDPEIERRNRLRDYEEKEIARYAGKSYTQRELDQLDSETFARIVRLRRFTGWLPPSANL